MKIRRLASSHGVGPSLWKSQMAALGRSRAFERPPVLVGWETDERAADAPWHAIQALVVPTWADLLTSVRVVACGDPRRLAGAPLSE